MSRKRDFRRGGKMIEPETAQQAAWIAVSVIVWSIGLICAWGLKRH